MEVRISLAGQLPGPPLKHDPYAVIPLKSPDRGSRFGRAIARPSIEAIAIRSPQRSDDLLAGLAGQLPGPPLKLGCTLAHVAAGAYCRVWPGNCPALH